MAMLPSKCFVAEERLFGSVIVRQVSILKNIDQNSIYLCVFFVYWRWKMHLLEKFMFFHFRKQKMQW
ncbi:hypothetical protein CRP01_06110 [Flavilitoribacter nigricans DSM 23189 = NBRC 102662]|uniref:Uncharacterized protein n=1 Tax=Flavilitoribacter nigricans (strain ATCC 23147 / DSM 23189 / NBRC 102662 / NCIMB 1420 / SS-2) TaxID=1122177 RepID=A0A2D0NGQ2_FLAN2|nr:hypothetical protein CRP01_06110 [Flavilitoribacter nigricans DSM 23189 = NBRC 102662]